MNDKIIVSVIFEAFLEVMKFESQSWFTRKLENLIREHVIQQGS